MKVKKEAKPVVVEEIDEEVDELIDNLEEEDIDEDEVDEEEEVVVEKKAKPEKAAKEKKEKKPSKNAVVGPDDVTVAMLAEQLQADPRELRMFLRANFTRPEEDKSNRWLWKKDSAELQKVIDAYKAKKAAPKNTQKAVKSDKPEVTVVK